MLRLRLDEGCGDDVFKKIFNSCWGFLKIGKGVLREKDFQRKRREGTHCLVVEAV